MINDILYFDSEGVASLAGQLPNAGLRGFTQQNEVESSTVEGIKPKFSLGKMMETIGLPTIEIGGELSNSHRHKSGRNENYEIPIEQVYSKLVAALSGKQQLFRNLDAARLASAARGGSVFCDLAATFRPSSSPASDRWREEANERGYLILTVDNDPLVRMGMSLRKLRGIPPEGIGATSHLAIGMRGLGGLRLSVFGRFDGTGYIKPFVVSHY
jgi:hypothetical protein